MISHQLQSANITGYYEYLSRIRQRVNVAPPELADGEETITQTTTTITSPSVDSMMNNDNTASTTNSSTTDNMQQQQLVNLTDKDVSKWSSNDVHQWVEEQCQKFELKKATTEKFQMNGQALVLLTKHDFLRRSPDGGEIIYYALQRLINPNKNSSVHLSQNHMKNGSWRQSARIVELGSDTDEHNSSAGSPPASKPIVEEPDDPPLYRKSGSGTLHDNHSHQNYPHSFFHSNVHIRQPMYGMPTAAYYHQQQVFPNAFMYAHHPHHVHPHMSQQQFFHPHQHSPFMHQYHPMMSAQGLLIEVLDNEEAKNGTTDGVNGSLNENSTNGASTDAQESLYMVTINGQRYVMNEEQVTQYVAEIHRQQQQQQQQQFQQQQQHQFHQQQQFHQQHQQQNQQQNQQQQQQFHHHHPQQHQQNPQHQQHQFHPQQQQQYNQHRQTSQDNIFHN